MCIACEYRDHRSRRYADPDSLPYDFWGSTSSPACGNVPDYPGNSVKVIKIPSLLSQVIVAALTGIDMMEFTIREECQYCRGPVKFHDIRAKRFATVIEKGEKRNINIRVYRYYCQDCGKLCYARAPFYPNTKFGSPVADLCTTLAWEHPFNHVAKILQMIGIVIDRGTIRNFSCYEIPPVSYSKIYGLPIPLSICYLSDLFSRNVWNYTVTQEEILEVCGFLVKEE